MTRRTLTGGVTVLALVVALGTLLPGAVLASAAGATAGDEAAPAAATPVVRDHRATSTPVVRDHRATSTPVVRDHRTPQTDVRGEPPLAAPATIPAKIAESAPCNCTGPNKTTTALVNSVRVRTKGTTTVVQVPPGVTVTRQTQVQVKWDLAQPGFTSTLQEYQPDKGIVLQTFYPVDDGTPKQHRLRVTITQPAAAGKPLRQVDYDTTVTSEALFSAHFDALNVKLIGNCDTLPSPLGDVDLGASEVEVFVADHGRHKFAFDLDDGESKSITAFAREFTDARVADGLQMPGLFWDEVDTVEIPGGFHSFPTDGKALFPPGPRSGAVDLTEKEVDGDNCSLQFHTQLTIKLQLYQGLTFTPDFREV